MTPFKKQKKYLRNQKLLAVKLALDKWRNQLEEASQTFYGVD